MGRLGGTSLNRHEKYALASYRHPSSSCCCRHCCCRHCCRHIHCCCCPQVPPGGTNFQFRDPTEGRHGVWLALTDPSNPNPLPNSSYALAVGAQSFCLGGAPMYSAPNMMGPWSYVGMLYSQLDAEPEVRLGEAGRGRGLAEGI
jgi:hypothetical protein